MFTNPRSYKFIGEYKNSTFTFTEFIPSIPSGTMTIHPNGTITFSCGEVITFTKAVEKEAMIKHPQYTKKREALINKLNQAYICGSNFSIAISTPKINEYKSYSLEQIVSQINTNVEKEAAILEQEIRDIPEAKYKRDTMPIRDISSESLKESIEQEANTKFLKWGVFSPSKNKISEYVSNQMSVLLEETKEALKEAFTFSEALENYKEVEALKEANEIRNSKIQDLQTKIQNKFSQRVNLSSVKQSMEAQFWSTLYNTSFNYKNSISFNLQAKCDMEAGLARLDITVPSFENCPLPSKFTKMKGKDIEVYEWDETNKKIMYSRLVLEIAYKLAITSFEEVKTLSKIIVRLVPSEKSNYGLCTCFFNREDLKDFNLSNGYDIGCFLPYLIFSCHNGKMMEYVELTDLKDKEDNTLYNFINKTDFANTIPMGCLQALNYANEIENYSTNSTNSELLESLVSQAQLVGMSSIRVPKTIMPLLKELKSTKKNSDAISSNSFKLLGSSVENGIDNSTTIFHFFNLWKKDQKDIMTMRGVTKIDYNHVRLTALAVSSRYTTSLLSKYDLLDKIGSHLIITKSTLENLEKERFMIEYKKYLEDLSYKAIKTAKVSHKDWEISRAIAELEHCVNCGTGVLEVYTTLENLYNQRGELNSGKKIADLRKKMQWS